MAQISQVMLFHIYSKTMTTSSVTQFQVVLANIRCKANMQANATIATKCDPVTLDPIRLYTLGTEIFLKNLRSSMSG